jgi:hypothetical protein
MLSRKVLIIDDEPDIQEVARVCWRSRKLFVTPNSVSLEIVAGWEVITASSEAEGIERAIQDQPEAVLLDVKLPGMDGPATLSLRGGERGHQRDTSGVPDGKRPVTLRDGNWKNSTYAACSRSRLTRCCSHGKWPSHLAGRYRRIG